MSLLASSWKFLELISLARTSCIPLGARFLSLFSRGLRDLVLERWRPDVFLLDLSQSLPVLLFSLTPYMSIFVEFLSLAAFLASLSSSSCTAMLTKFSLEL